MRRPSTKIKKLKRNKGKIKFKSKNQGCTSGKFAGINLEFSLLYYSLVFLFILWTWGCIWWLKLRCLFFFRNLWTKFTYGWVINNLDGFLTKFICCCVFTIAFWFDKAYFYLLLRLTTHLMIQGKKEPQNGIS